MKVRQDPPAPPGYNGKQGGERFRTILKYPTATDNSFKSFCKDLVFDTEAVSTSCKEITKKLNSYYYDEQGNDTDHFYYVGSVGRRTAIKNVSDIDVIFDLPTSTYIRFNAYESNGQSALLQEVKEVLKERYPKTDIKGDGQVVVIEFTT